VAIVRVIDITAKPIGKPGSLLVVPTRSALEVDLSERPNDELAVVGHVRTRVGSHKAKSRPEARPLVDLSDFHPAELSDFQPALTPKRDGSLMHSPSAETGSAVTDK
jgi:hypothetical protein